MRTAALVLALLPALAAAAVAQDGGGRMNWKGRSDPKTAMLDARDQRKPILLYFRTDASPLCRTLDEGPFSDPKVLDASVNVACIYVDCAWGKKNADLMTRFKVNGYPSLVFCDPEGNQLGYLNDRDAPTIAEKIRLLGNTYGGKGPEAVRVVIGHDYEKVRIEARKKLKPVLLYFADFSPASLSVNDALLDRSLEATLDRFMCAKAEFAKESRECVKFGVTRAPTILLLDPLLDKPESRPIARIEGSRTARELQRDLLAALPAADKSGAPVLDADSPSLVRPAAEEKLSDDIIERKFIWARVAVAQDLVKRGQKDKAVDVLEDILRSYPKHRDTEDVRKVLEEVRKK